MVEGLAPSDSKEGGDWERERVAVPLGEAPRLSVGVGDAESVAVLLALGEAPIESVGLGVPVGDADRVAVEVVLPLGPPTVAEEV